MVERRHSHSRNCSKFLHVQPLGVVCPEPSNRSCRPVTEVACRCDGTQAFSLRRSEYTVDDFTLDQVAEKGNILGSLEKLDQSRARAQQSDRRDTNSKSASLSRGFRFRKVVPAEDLAHCGHIEPEKYR